MNYPKPFENPIFDCIEHAISQYNIWADEIKEYDTNRHDRDDSSPFNGLILEHQGKLSFHCFSSPFDIGKVIKGWVDCYYSDNEWHQGLVFSYYLAKEFEDVIDTAMIEAYTKMLEERDATHYKWKVVKGRYC